MFSLTLSTRFPDIEDVLPVLSDAEQVDDGVPDHGDQGGPEQEHLVLQLVRPQVGHVGALARVDHVNELEDVHRGPGRQVHGAQPDRHLEEPVEFPVLRPSECAEQDGADNHEHPGQDVVDDHGGEEQVDGRVPNNVAKAALGDVLGLCGEEAARREFVAVLGLVHGGDGDTESQQPHGHHHPLEPLPQPGLVRDVVLLIVELEVHLIFVLAWVLHAGQLPQLPVHALRVPALLRHLAQRGACPVSRSPGSSATGNKHCYTLHNLFNIDIISSLTDMSCCVTFVMIERFSYRESLDEFAAFQLQIPHRSRSLILLSSQTLS